MSDHDENPAPEQEQKSIGEIVEEYRLPKNCPKINWGADFEAMPDLDKVVFLKKFADSFNYALSVMQEERKDWMLKAQNFETQLVASKEQLQKQIKMSQAMVKMGNDTKAVYQQKINALEAQIRGMSVALKE